MSALLETVPRAGTSQILFPGMLQRHTYWSVGTIVSILALVPGAREALRGSRLWRVARGRGRT